MYHRNITFTLRVKIEIGILKVLLLHLFLIAYFRLVMCVCVYTLCVYIYILLFEIINNLLFVWLPIPS